MKVRIRSGISCLARHDSGPATAVSVATESTITVSTRAGDAGDTARNAPATISTR